jgi:hypothetical protein
MRPPPSNLDAGHLAGALTALLIFAPAAVLVAHGAVDPAEDAAMLFAYSANLADSGVISFYPGGPRSEGATDFLYMVLLAALSRAGLAPALGAAVLTALGAAVTSAVCYEIARPSLGPLPSWRRGLVGVLIALALIGASFLAPALRGFSVHVFLAPIAVMALCCLRGWATGFFLAALATCLLRPDGVVFAAPLTLLFLWQARHRPRTWLLFAALLLLPGLAYFLWRWSYFGELLPLPFYVKTAGERDVAGLFFGGSIRANIYALANAVLLVALAALLALPWRRWPEVVRDNFALLATLAVSFLFYAAVQQEQNEGFRFQAPLVLLILLLFLRLPIDFAIRLPLLVVAALAGLMTLYDAARDVATQSRDDNIMPLAEALHDLPGGTMLVTEAGRLPYASGWIAIDSWGLNTAELSRRVILPDDVVRYRADLVVVHSYAPLDRIEALDFAPATERSWEGHAGNILLGAAAGYDMYFVPFYRLGSPTYQRVPRHDIYLVRRDSPLAAPLRELIAAHDGVDAEGLRRRRLLTPG